ncbi:MAG TPA: DUF4396 domain-containing protein [Polyangiaceae bacterium]|jgi:hypothetical protein|nr:DUF4396 domain-containing protein [Polyangiaceae bacterium]
MLIVIAWLSLAGALLSAAVIAIDLMRGHPQHMWIMNIVWPVTALWAGPAGLWAYFRYGRAGAEPVVAAAKARHEKPPSTQQPFRILAAKGTFHCGAGCALGDMLAETLALALPLTLFGHRMFGAWLYDFVIAFGLGIAFQYFTIKPMRDLSPADALKQALKADTLSLISWQVGMYGWMAIATFAIFSRKLPQNSALFWFMMQIAMCVGFATSYPVNRWLLRRGIKEKM